MKMTNDKGKYSQYLTVAGSYFANKGWVHLLLAGGLYILYKMFFRTSLPFFLTISSLPLMTAIFLLIIKYSKQSFYTLFTLQFLLAAAYAVTDIPLGVATLMCTLFVVVLLFAYGMHEKIDWSESRNGMLMLFLIWGVYCILEIANPNNVQAAWNISITHYLIYPIVCAVIVPLAIRNIKGIQWLLIIWSLFILLAAAKGYWQKTMVLMNVSSTFYTFWEEQELILFGPVFVISHSSVTQQTSVYTWLWVFHSLEFHFFI